MINQFTMAANAIKSELPTFKNIKTAQQQTETAKSVFGQIRADKKRKEEEYKEFRREVSRKANKANKRLDRLEEQGLDFSPAYRKAFENNPSRFGVRGIQGTKELLRENERLDKFLNSKTSTITGIKRYLEELAERRGEKIGKGEHSKFAIKNSNMFRAHARLSNFRSTTIQYSSDNEMEAINSIIEELNDGYAYTSDEIDAVVELAIEEQDKRQKLSNKRRHDGISKVKPVSFAANKKSDSKFDIDW